MKFFEDWEKLLRVVLRMLSYIRLTLYVIFEIKVHGIYILFAFVL